MFEKGNRNSGEKRNCELGEQQGSEMKEKMEQMVRDW